MSERRHARTAPRRTAPSGSWRPVLAWLAVLAILVQSTIPDFAMAARNAARHRAEVAAAHQVHHHQHHGAEQQRPETPAPAGNHDHETLCAFCLALATHGLAAGLGNALPVPVGYDIAALPMQRGIRPQPLFLTSLNPRAPPNSDQG
ncbi:DUF2946 family protein [Azospirillum sp. sgz301742]